MSYNVDQIRKNLQKATGGRKNDPDEFRPGKAQNSRDAIKYRFFILPPLHENDTLKSGVVKKSMENFFIAHGQHWINERPHPCPRVWDGSDCTICSYGFDLLRECKEKNFSKEKKEQIRKQWMPTTYFMVNILFTGWKNNPEELRGKIRYYNAPKTCMDKWEATILKDDKGDDEDPDAYGVFFDENAAFCFELAVLKEGITNSYKTSAFIKNQGIAVPMVRTPEGVANKKAIDSLLKSRVNLWDKIEVPDPRKIQSLANSMINGDDNDTNATAGGFDADENTETKPENIKKGTSKAAEKASTVSDKQKSSKSSQIQTEAKKTSEKASSKETAETSASDLDDEIPFTDDTVETTENPNTTLESSDDDINGDDISELLSQLDE